MALCICATLGRLNGFNARDLAWMYVRDLLSSKLHHLKPSNTCRIFFSRFSAAYDVAPQCRLYGASIGELFKQMKATEFADPYKIAGKQFSGRGSYGNGGAMRITPVALYCLNFPVGVFNVSQWKI